MNVGESASTFLCADSPKTADCTVGVDGTFSFNDAFTQDLWDETNFFDPVPGGNYFATTGDGVVDFLSAFDGAPLAGTWRLTVRDTEEGDIGSFESWQLTLDPAIVAVPDPASLALFGMAIGGLAFARRRKSA